MPAAKTDSFFLGLPLQIKVGPFTVKMKVVERVDESNSLGAYSFDRGEIELRMEHSSAAFAVDTVIHELLHSIYRIFALSEKNEEEQIVSALATGLVQVMCDNPRLISWITKTLKRK